MNRRKAIFAMVSGIIGTQNIPAENLPVEGTKPSFIMDLDGFAGFVFNFESKTITLTAEEIWKEPQP